ncbi:hypothetical protein TSAR_010217 [Trichomalopsis sarcophagae]|uniref:Uncharacterized protein n=1 Tax=Trichomalopsis sarcophagae TaxID=543379 RepID=A0A232FN37_9HYME|nr:hypothetical protein TSAR_010217 [Trichomalopsis sarcophagae]
MELRTVDLANLLTCTLSRSKLQHPSSSLEPVPRTCNERIPKKQQVSAHSYTWITNTTRDRNTERTTPDRNIRRQLLYTKGDRCEMECAMEWNVM